MVSEETQTPDLHILKIFGNLLLWTRASTGPKFGLLGLPRHQQGSVEQSANVLTAMFNII